MSRLSKERRLARRNIDVDEFRETMKKKGIDSDKLITKRTNKKKALTLTKRRKRDDEKMD